MAISMRPGWLCMLIFLLHGFQSVGAFGAIKALSSPIEVSGKVWKKVQVNAIHGCDVVCTLSGEESTCINRIRWTERHVFASHNNSCELAYSKTQVECDVCRACSVQAAGCKFHHVASFHSPYDCNAALKNFFRAWSPAKKHWCCRHEGKGCEGTSPPSVDAGSGFVWKHVQVNGYWTWQAVLALATSAPYDCNAALKNFFRAWSPAKKHWCCRHEGKGCEGTSPPSVDAGSGKVWKHVQVNGFWTWQAVLALATSGPYDCNAALKNFFRAWSPAKKHWCCRHEGKGCEGTSPPSVDAGSGKVWKHVQVNGFWTWQAVLALATSGPYDCNAALKNFFRAWSPAKKHWCCRHEGKGCEGTSPPSVDAGSGKVWKHVQVNGYWTWQAATALTHEVHQGHNNLQVHRVRYDCNAGFSNWLQGWSNKKKDWCCSHHNRGCQKHDCFSGSPNTWSAEKRSWCCTSFLRGCQGRRPDCVQAAQGNLSEWHALQSIKPNAECPGHSTLLHEATKHGNLKNAKFLLKKGAKANSQDAYGNSPLHLAAKSSNLEEVSLLLRANATVFLQNVEGNTALHLTTSPEIAQMLLAYRAQVDARNKRGQTALYLSARRGASQVAQLLLEQGAAVDAQDNFFGKTPLAEAAANDHLKMEQKLLNHGADAFRITYDGRMIESMAEEGEVQELLKNQTTLMQLSEKPQLWLWLPLAALVGFCGSAVGCLWRAKSPYSPLLQPTDDVDFFHGAKLIVAKTKTRFAGLGLLVHVVGVSSKLVLVFAGGMWIVHWPFWMFLHICLYGLPAVMSLGLGKIAKSPALVLIGSAPALDLARLLFLVSIIVVLARPGDCNQDYYHSAIAQSVCAATPWVPAKLEEFLMLLRNPAWKALLRKPHYVWSKTGYTFSFETFGDSSENTEAFVRVHAADVPIVLMLGLFAACLLHLVISISMCILGSPSATEHSHTDDAEVEELLEKTKNRSQGVWMPPGVEVASKWITLESSWNFDSIIGFMSCINVKVGLLFLDVLLDINTLKTMLESGHFMFAVCMMVILSKSLSQQMMAGSIWSLSTAREKTINRGIQHRILLEILVEEQGFEAFTSLALTTYSYWYTVADAFAASSQLFSIVLSVYSLAAFLYQCVDLAIDIEDSPSKQRPSETKAPKTAELAPLGSS